MQHVCNDFADLIWKLHHTLALMHVANSALETTKSSLQRLLPKSAIKARIAESFSAWFSKTLWVSTVLLEDATPSEV